MLRLSLKQLLRVLLPSLVLILLVSVVFAQDNRQLMPGTAVTGLLNADNVAQVYTFQGEEGQNVSLTFASLDNLAVTLLVTDSNGASIAQIVGDGSQGQFTLESIPIEATSTYFVTVFPSAGATVTQGSFLLTLNVELGLPETEPTATATEAPTATAQAEGAEEPTEATETDIVQDVETTQEASTADFVAADFLPGQQVILNNGINVSLTWNTTDDLNLQIRDPSGGTLFWDSRTTDDGGTFGPDVNGLCEVITTPPAVETASWAGGPLPAGSYEVLVYYRQACEGNQAVDFSVDVSVDGQPLEPIEGVLLPPVNNEANVYIGNFVVNPDGTAATGANGPYVDERELDVEAQELLDMEADTVVLDQVQLGLITNQEPYQTYRYEGVAGELISVGMTAISGNLDTLLLVLDENGTVTGANDDVQPVVNTNSQITGLPLPTDGVYTIVATRYGKSVAGTQGEYELVVNGSNIPQQFIDLNLPAGDIQIALTWDTNADLQLLVRDPSGNSVYDDVPSVPSGGRLTEQGNINCNIAENAPISYIYWPEGFSRIGSYEIEVWYQSECNDTRPVIFTLTIVVNGELVFTESVPFQFNQRYLTSFSIAQSGEVSPSAAGIIGGSETLPYTEELASAVNIIAGETVAGSITPDNKFDLYRFQGQAGDQVTISMNATSSTLDTLLFLIDPNGVEIAQNDDSNETTNSLITGITLAQDGEYIVIATHYGTIYGGTTGSYNLNLRIDN